VPGRRALREVATDAAAPCRSEYDGNDQYHDNPEAGPVSHHDERSGAMVLKVGRVSRIVVHPGRDSNAHAPGDGAIFERNRPQTLACYEAWFVSSR
jgi:hypothetical protein